MRQTVHAVPGKVGLLLFLLGKESSKTGNSQEMLRSTSWKVRFLTAPVSSPTGLCPQHLPQFGQPGTGWVHQHLTDSPPWDAQPGDAQPSEGSQDGLLSTAALLQKHSSHIPSSA